MHKEKIASVFHGADEEGNVPHENIQKFGNHAMQQALHGHYRFQPVEEKVIGPGHVRITFDRIETSAVDKPHENSVDPTAEVKGEHDHHVNHDHAYEGPTDEQRKG